VLERGGESAFTSIKRNQNTTSKGSEKNENKVGNSFWIGPKPS
jgi:hypothetical protein